MRAYILSNDHVLACVPLFHFDTYHARRARCTSPEPVYDNDVMAVAVPAQYFCCQ